MSFKTVYVVVMTCLFLAMGCSKKAAAPAQGGQDSGGGNTQKSTPEDVELVIKNAFEDLHIPLTRYLDDITSVGGTSFSPQASKRKQDLIHKIEAINLDEIISTDIQKKINDLNEEDYKKYQVSLAESQDELDAKAPPQILALRKSIPADQYEIIQKKMYFERVNKEKKVRNILFFPKIKFNRGTLCSSHDNDLPEASISEFKVDSTICFNINLLTNIPPNELKNQIYAIIVHEFVHMLGFGEQVADIIQNDFSIFYAQASDNSIRSIGEQLRYHMNFDYSSTISTLSNPDFTTKPQFARKVITDCLILVNIGYQNAYTLTNLEKLYADVSRYNQNLDLLDYLNSTPHQIKVMADFYKKYYKEVGEPLIESCGDSNYQINLKDIAQKNKEYQERMKIHLDRVYQRSG